MQVDSVVFAMLAKTLLALLMSRIQTLYPPEELVPDHVTLEIRAAVSFCPPDSATS